MFLVFFCSLLRIKTTKMNEKHAIWGKKKTILKGTFLFNVYERVKHQKANRMQSTIYGKTKRLNQKCVFWLFFS